MFREVSEPQAWGPPVSWGFKGLSTRRGKPAARITVLGTWKCAQAWHEFARTVWAYDLQHRKISHKLLAHLVPRIPRPFSNLFFLVFPHAHPGFSCFGLFSFSQLEKSLRENQGQECSKATT